MSEAFKLEPCPSNLFVGRKREIDKFSEILTKIANQEDISHGIILHGRAGIGKKSFLLQAESIAKLNDFVVIRYDVPYINTEGYFDYIGNELDQIHLPENKRKPITKPGKKAPLIERAYEITDKQKYLDLFMKKLAKKFPGIIKKIQGKKFNKKGIIIISNFLERFIILNYDSALDIFKTLDEGLRNDIKNPNLPILFLLSVWEKYYPKVRYVLKDFHEIGLPTLNDEDAERLLDKRADVAGVKFSDEIKQNLIRQSGGIPLNLVYNAGWIYENRGDARELGKDVWFKAESGIKEGFGRELKNLSEEERKVLQAFAMENANFADIDTIARSIGIKIEDVKPILEKMVGKYLSNEGNVYYVTLDSFWMFLRSSLGDIALDAQARGLIKIALNLAENGRLLEDFQYNELEKIRKDALVAGLVSTVEHIANGYYDMANYYFNYGYYNEVFKFILLAGVTLVDVNEKEKAANILEIFANKFIDQSLLDYARDILIKAIEINKELGEIEKAKNLTVRLAKLCEEKANKCIDEGSYPLARANYTQAVRYYKEIEAFDQTTKLLLRAAENFMAKEEYFYAWQFYTNLSNTYAELGNIDKANEILDASIQRFQDAGLVDYVEKLSIHRSKIGIKGGS